MANPGSPVSLPREIARTIREGFDKHYRLFRQTGERAKERFERGAWAEVHEASRARIQMYDQRVVEAGAALRARFPDAVRGQSLWPEIKRHHIRLLPDYHQPECAQPLLNS